MPDLKTALTTALSAWEKDDQQIQQEKKVKALPNIFKPTNNVTLETFNYVKNNPNKNSNEIRTALSARGFNEGSVGSLLTQFTKQGQFVKDSNARYSAIVSTYTPLKSTKKFRAEGKRKNKIVTVKSKSSNEGIAALQVDTTPKAVPKTDVQSLLRGLNILQARALYDELKKIFGG
jgi:hypothetical protein